MKCLQRIAMPFLVCFLSQACAHLSARRVHLVLARATLDDGHADDGEINFRQAIGGSTDGPRAAVPNDHSIGSSCGGIKTISPLR
jgi:hypothetical protein